MANPYGLGCLEGPADDRDYPVAMLFTEAGVDAAAPLPASFLVGHRGPVLDQGDSPMCVAFSTSALKTYQDRTDQPVHHWFNFDEARFFRAIGGTANGAVLRNALDRLVKVGYPVVSGEPAADHRIKAYYAIPKNMASVKATIKAFGEIVLSTPWYHSWFRPDAKTHVLPRPDYVVGGHAILADGWDDRRGLRLRNSWGAGWGSGGDAFMSYHYAEQVVREYWKVVDL